MKTKTKAYGLPALAAAFLLAAIPLPWQVGVPVGIVLLAWGCYYRKRLADEATHSDTGVSLPGVRQSKPDYIDTCFRSNENERS